MKQAKKIGHDAWSERKVRLTSSTSLYKRGQRANQSEHAKGHA